MSDERFTAATKLDAGKPPMELIPWEAMEGVARVLDFGRVKYAAHNWRKGFEWCRLAGAGLRHVFKFLSGEDLDPESGEHHIDHALCCFMFLSAHVKSELGRDDRAHTLKQPISSRWVPVHEKVWYQAEGLLSGNRYGPLFSSREACEAFIAREYPVGAGIRPVETGDYEVLSK